MLRLKSDLFEVFELACAGTLDRAEIEWDRRTALGVVLAAANYPDTPKKGAVVTGLVKHTERSEDCMVFHAGTALEDDKVLVQGGRVLCVTALGDSVKMAQQSAYHAVEKIRFDGMQFRRDIGHRAIPARKA
jgi:phosphoribosylamine--glycine ligase